MSNFRFLTTVDNSEDTEQSIVIFDGTSYFTAWVDYDFQEDEEVVFSGTFRECEEEADRLNGGA